MIICTNGRNCYRDERNLGTNNEKKKGRKCTSEKKKRVSTIQYYLDSSVCNCLIDIKLSVAKACVVLMSHCNLRFFWVSASKKDEL